MAGAPGTIGSQVPPGPDELWKQIAALDARLQQVQATANAALATAVAGLAAGQVSPVGAATSVSSFNTSTSQNAIASLSFTVPAGFSRAVMFGVGSTTSTNFSGTQRYMYTRIILGASSGPEQNIIVQDFNTSPYADTLVNLSCAHAYIATGLSGGSVIAYLTTRSSAGTFGTNALNNATLSASVLFLV